MSLVCDALPGDQHVKHRMLSNVVDRLLVRDHREVVAVALEDLVAQLQAALAGRTLLQHARHVDAVVGEALQRLSVVQVDAAAHAEAGPQLFLTVHQHVALGQLERNL